MPFPRMIRGALVAAACALVSASADETFSGLPTQRITLQRAIELALQNNLEARFEHSGIDVEQARVRFAAGAFDPVFNIQTQRQSLKREQDINNPSTANAVQQQRQLQLQINQAAQNLNVQLINAQQQSINQSSVSQAQLQQFQDVINTQRNLQGLPSIELPSVQALGLSLLQQQPLVEPSTNNIIALQQRSDQAVSSLQGRTPLGTRYSFQISANRSRNTFTGDPNAVRPIAETFVGLTIEQPLLRNFGPGANLAELRIARLNKKIQVLQWKQNVSSSVQGVMATYYDMLFALQDIRVRESAIEADGKLVQLYRRRVDLGFSTPFDIQRAEVAVSTDREQLLVSKNIFMERQFALKRLILAKFDLNDPRIFMPEDAPTLHAPKLTRTEALQSAFERRYDYRSAILTAESQDVRLRFARNQLLPQLDFVATYGLNGLDQDYGDSFHRAFSGDTPQWTIGLNFQVPLGNVQPRAQLKAALGQKEQAIIRVKQSELTVGVDVDTVLSRIQTNRQRVSTARETRALNEEAVRVAYRQLEEGLISAFDILDQQRKLYEAKSRELGALSELNKSITQLWLVTGTVLERQGIGFHEPAK